MAPIPFTEYAGGNPGPGFTLQVTNPEYGSAFTVAGSDQSQPGAIETSPAKRSAGRTTPKEKIIFFIRCSSVFVVPGLSNE
ncbi:MAG: hypothetical protein A2096_07010 [Spirochaetes bacterium GWF1_41_5]|nr:MAG: hypothetical protein A2096_07010 [Spirochaetes bacterium GWF1_41_5]